VQRGTYPVAWLAARILESSRVGKGHQGEPHKATAGAQSRHAMEEWNYRVS